MINHSSDRCDRCDTIFQNFLFQELRYMQIADARILLWEEGIGMDDKQIQELLSLVKSICSIVVTDYIEEKKATKPDSPTPQQTNLCLQ